MERSRAPFQKNEIIEHDGQFSEVATIYNNQNYYAKTVSLTHEFHKDGEEAQDYEKRLEQFLKDSKLIEEYLGEFVPEFHIAIGHPDWEHDEKVGAPTIFMKKVTPALKFESNDFRNYISQLDEFYTKAVDLFVNTYDGELGYVADAKPGNFIYGRTNTDKQSKLYLVDLYPIFRFDIPNFNKLIETLVDKMHATKNITINNNVVDTAEFEDTKIDFTKTTNSLEKLNDLIKT